MKTYIKLVIQNTIMGCDFYIHKYLEIAHKNGVSYYSLKDERGWFCEMGLSWDGSDHESSDNKELEKERSKLYSKMMTLCLSPRSPLVLYENGKFVSNKFKQKYSKVLQDKIENKYVNYWCLYKDTGSFSNMEDVICITKKEIRYEPGEDAPEFRRVKGRG